MMLEVMQRLSLKEMKWSYEKTLGFDVWQVGVYDVGPLLLFWYELNI